MTVPLEKVNEKHLATFSDADLTLLLQHKKISQEAYDKEMKLRNEQRQQKPKFRMNKDKIKVEDNQLKVPSGSKAVLMVDFLGTATIDLRLNKYVSTYHSAGDVLIGENAPDMLGSIQNNVLPQLTAMLPKIDTILTGIQAIVTNPALSESIDHLNRITADLEVSSKKLSHIMDKDMPPILANVTGITENVNEFSSRLNELDLKKTVVSVDSTLLSLQSITNKLNNNDNTLGLLLNDKQLYDGLLNTVGSADSLLIDLRLNPKRYVHFSLFGRKK